MLLVPRSSHTAQSNHCNLQTRKHNSRDFGLRPSPVILKARERDVQVKGGKEGNTPGSVLPLHLRMETDPVFETSLSLVFGTHDHDQSPKT
jgi:hypothetical protein